MKEFKDLIFEAFLAWEKKRGLVVFFILILGTYYFLIRNIINEGNPTISFWTINLWIPLSLCSIIFLLWLFTTNRIPLP